MKFKRQSAEEPNVNLTSLIDVVFLLLIFFMVSTTFQKDNHITLTLPQADNKQQQTQADIIYISVSSAGEYGVNSRALVKNDAKTLSLAIQNLEIKDKKTPVIVAADAQASHQSVVTVMDVAARLGFSKVSIATTELAAE
jgi:biopolymer transport protein ExbD